MPSRFTVSFAVAAATSLLGGCTSSQSQPIPASRAAVQAGYRPSWMTPHAKAANLLYVSNHNGNTVTVYSFRPAALVGTLTGFSSPNRLCVDKAQDVYVTDGTGNIYEYAHGGTSPINTLSESPTGGPPRARWIRQRAISPSRTTFTVS